MSLNKWSDQTAFSSGKIDFHDLCIKNIKVASTIKNNRVKQLLSAIRSLNFSNNTEMQFSEAGMKYITEHSQYFQGIAFFSPEFFEKYRFASNDSEILYFGIDLASFSEFFGAVIENDLANLKIVYYGEHRPIVFIFTQFEKHNNEVTCNQAKHNKDSPGGKITTEYTIKIKQSINHIDFSSIELRIFSTIVLDACDFVELIHDLDKGTDEIFIRIRNQACLLRSVGTIQCQTKISLPSNHKMFKRYDFKEESRFIYKFFCFKSMLKALSICSKACLETNENGLLKIQLMGKAFEEENSLFYEFNIMPTIDEDDEEIKV